MSFAGGRPPYSMPGTFTPGMHVPQQFAQYGAVPPGMPVRPGLRMPGLLPTPPGTIPSTVSQPIIRQNQPSHPTKIRRDFPLQGSFQKNNIAANQDDKSVDDANKPKTTVFVGNISDRAPDSLIKGLLGKCGSVLSWKRVQGASGKLQAFGFCEYGDPDASLRAMRLLHELEVGDKKLVVKVDQKTRTLLDDYLQNKDGEKGSEGDEKEDSDIATHVRRMLHDCSMQLHRQHDDKGSFINSQKQKLKDEKQKAKDKLDDMNLEDDKKDLINREINRFRQSYKDQRAALEQKETPEEKEKSRREREKEREKERQHKEQIKEREKNNKDRVRSRDWERSGRDRAREEREERDRERERRERARSPERDWDRGNERRDRSKEHDRSDDRDRSRGRDRLEEEEDYEKRKLERKLREKEEAYQSRLRDWETREHKRQREHEKMKEKEEVEKVEMDKEGKRLKEFLEDYEDERDDPKYYKGSALDRRRKEREKEEDSDSRDRRREREEIEDIKRRLMEEGGEDLDAEIEKLESERDKHKQPLLDKLLTPRQLQIKPEPQPSLKPTFEPAEATRAEEVIQGPQTPASSSDDDDDDGGGGFEPLMDDSSQSSLGDEDSNSAPVPKMTFGGLKLVGGAALDEAFELHVSASTSRPDREISVGAASPQSNSRSERGALAAMAGGKRKKLTLGEVFNQEEDGAEFTGGKKKRKLVPIEYSEEEMKAVGQSQKIASAAEEKRKTIKNLIEKIPTAKEELFAYKVDWAIVDESLMDRRIKPWINKKIVEYIGEEEPTLTEFICSKLLIHSSAESILSDITMVLDEEAEVFVVKMWRLLIYEVEAKKHGLVK